MVSQATRLAGSSRRQASSMASEIWSAILSGCPSVTDSEVNRKRFVGKLISPKGMTSRSMRGAYDTKWLWAEVSLVLIKTVPEMAFGCNEIGVTVTCRQRVVPDRIERQPAAGKRKEKKDTTLLRKRRRAWGRLQAVWAKSKGLHFSIVALRIEFFPVEDKGKRASVSSLDDDLFLSMNRALVFCHQGLFNDGLAICRDGDPGVFPSQDDHRKLARCGSCGRDFRGCGDGILLTGRHRLSQRPLFFFRWRGGLSGIGVAQRSAGRSSGRSSGGIRHRFLSCCRRRGLAGMFFVVVVLVLPTTPEPERQGHQQQDRCEQTPGELSGGSWLTWFRGGDLGFHFGVCFGGGAFSGGFQVVGHRLVFVHSHMLGIGAHKAFVEYAAGQLVEFFFFQSLQHAHSDFGGEGNLLQRDGTFFALELQFFAKGRQAILPSGSDGDGILLSEDSPMIGHSWSRVAQDFTQGRRVGIRGSGY